MELEFRNLKLEDLDKPANFLVPIILSALEQTLHPIFLFTGQMGAGKTTFTSKLVKKISPNANVNSPTYTLVNEYPISNGSKPEEESKFYHFDLHRLKSPAELEDLGFEEIWKRPGVSIVEWWQIANEDLESFPLKIEAEFKTVSEEERNITFKSSDIEKFPNLKNLWKESEGNPV
ncbi:tRNA (adenosine(37)-N6)-threonylcarbamoyltransferase complex ATPase subunit type 1 TsaE [Leptospira yasudae]|uniref:tRNA (adenosine(37)-N6)-threonylcarbamoyltransferase complex ATPase subunit type 1 TsaE n=1 Tax=Leptospira yasudae TaxID=2202201 RepID=UPI001C4E5F3F|nr:tRNA (adenosine(37)-N6)-threonylcarbamoyltransferase complex ATPase subunit type 1 TsaE [Leptospira yasudae]MBW0433166.1 tRNA (adenosine(37)-N6)-threonylcarbamoyltransferase complex ATPase subunit type 1 TsaE [Leptospira yasudae]